jgi:DNA-binding transcriptional ArsR family regulator
MGRPTESAAAPDPLQGWADGLLGFGHPVRLRALVLLEDEYSPKGLAEVMGDTPLGVVAYHVRMLRGYGLVEEVRTEPVRGAVEHFYHRTELADTLVAKLAALFDVPPYRSGQLGTERRREALAAWAYREPPAEPEPEAEAA